MYILSHLSGNIDYAQRENHAVGAKGLGEHALMSKMAGEVNMGTKLPGKFKGLNQAFQHRVTPIENSLAQLHAALRDTSPEGTIVIQGMGQLYPFVFRSLQFI